MDELDKLKKDWNRENPSHKKMSAQDIYAMLHKKSSSIVKTLFYISIAELVFWILVNALPYACSDAYKARLDQIYGNDHLFTVLTLLTYAIILVFIYLLFKSYKAVSVTDNAKTLMENILKTRKVIKYYVLYNLILAGISLFAGFYYALHNDPKTAESIVNFSGSEMLMMYVILFLFAAIFILIIWLFYRLIYGLLLKRLYNNYKELKKIDE